MCINYVQGANSYGQLCNGNCEDILSPNSCKVTEEVVKDIQSIAGGGGHTVILTSDLKASKDHGII